MNPFLSAGKWLLYGDMRQSGSSLALVIYVAVCSVLGNAIEVSNDEGYS